MSALLHFGKSATPVSLKVECFQPSLYLSGGLNISFSCMSSPSSLQTSDGICHGSIQTSNSSCTPLDRGFLASHSSQHFGRHSSLISDCKIPCKGYSGRPGAEGIAIIAFNCLAVQRHVIYRQGFSS